MGKNLIQQRRGKGSIYRIPKHIHKGSAKHAHIHSEKEGAVIDIITSRIHSAPLMKVKFGKDEILMIAPVGIGVGDKISYEDHKVKIGNSMPVGDIPEGTYIYNIEKEAGDGGKFVRASGNFARVLQKTPQGISIALPSKKIKIFNPECRATIGIVAGGGRTEKPFTKAGNKFKLMRARHKLYPKVCGISMNAVDHPFGGKSSKIKGRPMHVSRHTSPGRKVGKIAPRRTGKKR